MRILHIISQKPGETGSGIFVKNLLRVGHKKGYEQALIAGISSKDKNWDNGYLKNTVFYQVVFETEALPFPVTGMSDVMPYESTKYCDMDEAMIKAWKRAFKAAIIEAAEEFRPQLVISHHLWILTALVKELLPGIPVIGICHGTDLRQLDRAIEYRDYVINGIKKLEQIIVLSDYQRGAVIEKYGLLKNKISVAGGGYDESIFYPKKDKHIIKPIKIIYAGKLSFAKGVNALIKAMSLLPYENNDIVLILAGSGTGAQEECIRSLAQNCPYTIQFLGSISQERLGQIYREDHIFVMPSFYEGLSLVTIEALASGLRVVANDLPGMRQWLGDEIVESGTVSFVKMPALQNTDIPVESELPDYEKRLADAIKQQIDAVNAGSHVSAAVPEIIRNKFSWESVFIKIEDVIGDAIGDDSR